MEGTGHRQIDHTADLALEIWAPTAPELMAEAARAIVAILTEDATIREETTEEVSIEAWEEQDRLVQFLNEIIYQAVVKGFLVRRAEVRLFRDRQLSATLHGCVDPSLVRTELKSATYHDLAYETGPNGAFARVVIDV